MPDSKNKGLACRERERILEMIKQSAKKYIPYIGLPLFPALLIILRWSSMDPILLVSFCTLSCFCYAASVIDVTTKRVPNYYLLLMLAFWACISVPQLFLRIEWAVEYFTQSLIGLLLGGGLFLLTYWISRKGLGGADVKFMGIAGLYLGGWSVLPAMLIGSILTAVTALTLMVLRKIGRKDTIPMLPFLSIGIYLAMLLH